MASASIYNFNKTDASNTSFAGITQAENSMKPSDVNDDFRAHDGAFARWLMDIGATGTVGGTGNAITLTLNETSLSAYGSSANQIPNGAVVAFKAGAANSGATTINVNAIGTKAIRAQGDTALAGGEILSGGVYVLRYDTAYNSAAGAWVLLNSTVPLSGYLPLTGGTLTGALSISITGGTASSTINAVTASNNAALNFASAGVTKFQIGKDAGDGFFIYDNAAGTNIVTGATNAALNWNRALNEAATVTIASGSTVNIGAAASNQIIISGTTTITAFDTVAAGVTREVLFSGALTLTHNGTSLILPGTANITTAANDTAKFRSLGSGNWVCLWYKKADGTSVAQSGGMTLLGTLTTTSGTTQSVTSIAAGYRAIMCELEGVSFGSLVALTVATSSTNGAAYGSAGTVTGALTNNTRGFTGAIWIYNISSTAQTQVASSSVIESSGSTLSIAAVACPTNSAAVVNAIQFAGGTFDAGTIRVYGVK